MTNLNNLKKKYKYNIFNINNDTKNNINNKKIKNINNDTSIKNNDTTKTNDTTIKLNTILINSLWNNKILSLSIILLFTGYWFQDILFSRSFSKILVDIPKFADELDFSKILTIFFPYLLAYFFFYADDIILANVFPKMEIDVIHQLLDKIFESIKTTKHNLNINELILNLKSIMDIKNIYNLTVVFILPTLIIGCSLLYYFFKSDFNSGLYMVSILILFTMFNIYLEKKCINVSREHEQKIDNLYDNIQDLVVNYETIITNNTKEKELQILKKIENICSDKHRKSEIITSETTLGLSILSMVLMMTIDAIAINLYYKKIITSEMLVTICMLCYTFTQYYNSSIFKFKSVMHHIGKYNELVDYFDKFHIQKENDNKFGKIINGSIVFKNVYPIHDNTIAKKSINIEIQSGKKVGITGEIGCGKTSILKILSGLKKYQGDVFIDGYNLSDFSSETITDNIIYIQQHPKLFNRTILENLSYENKTKYTDEEVIAHIDNLGLSKFFTKFPNGIHTNVGKEGSKLSGGQKQIVALIRAIIHQKKIILLDEPTSSLDPETKQIFMDLVGKIENKTIIIVTHDKSINNLFDTIIHL